ncbi:serine/threonine-protein kinase [Spongiactinospora rosea]|uniref:serine/threonine-protein kinase n=1 Tax=Spongiactinospora rosea TaxID=2248750 RepID=UPI0013146380|nr:serine/threonine protein kinase [Spongiactinospora rosea]
MSDHRAPEFPEIGEYRISARLGEGGQGTVYLGESAAGGQVAIKVLNSWLAGDDETRRRFRREAEVAASVATFCTAKVIGTGLVGGRPYIVSEYVPGPSLERFVKTEGPRTGSGLERLAVATLTALASIHAAGVLHRDFKPGNVILGPEGPVVIDFGIARASGHTTSTRGLMGTPSFMSPEQLTGSPVSPASDLFSWAGTMVYAATGRPAFPGAGVPAVLHAIAYDEAHLTGVPDRLLPLVAACLAKDPAARPTATQLLQSLTSHDNPALPLPPPPGDSGPAEPWSTPGAPAGPWNPAASAPEISSIPNSPAATPAPWAPANRDTPGRSAESRLSGSQPSATPAAPMSPASPESSVPAISHAASAPALAAASGPQPPAAPHTPPTSAEPPASRPWNPASPSTSAPEAPPGPNTPNLSDPWTPATPESEVPLPPTSDPRSPASPANSRPGVSAGPDTPAPSGLWASAAPGISAVPGTPGPPHEAASSGPWASGTPGISGPSDPAVAWTSAGSAAPGAGGSVPGSAAVAEPGGGTLVAPGGAGPTPGALDGVPTGLPGGAADTPPRGHSRTLKIAIVAVAAVLLVAAGVLIAPSLLGVRAQAVRLEPDATLDLTALSQVDLDDAFTADTTARYTAHQPYPKEVRPQINVGAGRFSGSSTQPYFSLLAGPARLPSDQAVSVLTIGTFASTGQPEDSVFVGWVKDHDDYITAWYNNTRKTTGFDLRVGGELRSAPDQIPLGLSPGDRLAVLLTRDRVTSYVEHAGTWRRLHTAFIADLFATPQARQQYRYGFGLRGTTGTLSMTQFEGRSLPK